MLSWSLTNSIAIGHQKKQGVGDHDFNTFISKYFAKILVFHYGNKDGSLQSKFRDSPVIFRRKACPYHKVMV